MQKGHDLVVRSLQLREAAAVERSHNTRHQWGYSNGLHTHNMLSLLDLLYPGDPPYSLVRAILLHDVHERWLGDMPAPAKALDPELGTAYAAAAVLVEEELGLEVPIPSNQAEWLHALDKLEFYMFCLDELNGGNNHLRPAATRMEDWFTNADMPTPIAHFWLALNHYGWERTDERVFD